jgi:hypothetical protein
VNIIVDNSAGGDSQFAEEVVAGLKARGLDVDLWPSRGSLFDTGVHQVDAGTVIRVSERPDGATLTAIEQVVRTALQHRSSLRRRTRSVAVRLTESERAIAWIDVFG